MENFLLQGEEVVMHSPNNVVVLTTHRIRYHAASTSQAHLVSVMLEKVSSCEVRYDSQPMLLVIGTLIALAGGLGLTQGGQASLIGFAGALVGAFLILAYFMTRKHMVSIASDGGARIGFATTGMKREYVVGLINSLEMAKHQRIVNLAQVGRPAYM
ncbi:hypothetical protein ACFST9_04130 [Hymenobacter monticola]|uniref:Uncharacterized protein n=1 Tax=Hymenobacter monticola TaxID=1705399 RepID=A0ABY4B115_9BACT|nr:hypothetical protein [Hymenobacter monticola]UOE32858.1 hypothetical protein MTP16_17190 [Hymenobacter monticola]